MKSLQEPSDVWLIHHLCLQLGRSKMDSGHSQWLSLVSRQPDTALDSTSGLNQPALRSRTQWEQGKLHSLLQTSWKEHVRLQHYTCIFTSKYSLWMKAQGEPDRQLWSWSGEGKRGLNNKSAPDPQPGHRNSSQSRNQTEIELLRLIPFTSVFVCFLSSWSTNRFSSYFHSSRSKKQATKCLEDGRSQNGCTQSK